MTESIAGALLKQSVNLKMNPLSSGPELPSPPPNDPPISSVPGPGDIEAGKVSNPGTLAEKKEDLRYHGCKKHQELQMVLLWAVNRIYNFVSYL